MSEDDFSKAIDQALELSDQFEAARRAVRRFVAQFADAVRTKTGFVEVRLVDPTQFSSIVAMTAVEIARLTGTARRELGDDEEDRDSRQMVVARVPSGENRILWEFEFTNGAGYPVTIHGPDRGATTACYSEGDLRAEILEAAAHGTVGRKIKGLVDAEQRRARPQAPVAPVQPPGDPAKPATITAEVEGADKPRPKQ